MENLAAHQLNDRVIVALSYDNNEGCYGTVQWMGHVKSSEYATESTTSLPFLYGVVLDQKRGNSDGSLRDKRRFQCKPGFGVFVPPNHIKPLPPDQDPKNNNNPNNNMSSTRTNSLQRIEECDRSNEANTSNVTIHRAALDPPVSLVQKSSINKGLLITRGQEPNHLYQGNLFFFLRKLGFRGLVNYEKIGVIDFSDKIEKIKTKSMLQIVYPQTNEHIYSYLPLLSKSSEYDAIFNPERNSQIDYSRNGIKKRSIDDDIKEREEDNQLPCVEMWYLHLHESWHKHSNKIKALGVSDYQSSQWVTQSEKRVIYWYSLLDIDEKNAISQAKTRFDSAPLPLFLKHKQEILEQKENDHDDMKMNGAQSAKQSLYSSICSHYIPLGIFHNKVDHKMINEVGFLEGPPIPDLIEKINQKIEFRLKRLIHEPVANLKDILPYLHSKQYEVDKKDNNYGWFPVDWVYAEVDINDDEVEQKWAMAFLNYTAPFEDDDDDLNINNDPNMYNPYLFMKHPRIPLFILSVRLPLKPLQQYAVKCVNERYGSHSPMYSPNMNGTGNDNGKTTSRHLQVHQPQINTSLSIDNDSLDINVNTKTPTKKKKKDRDRNRNRNRDRERDRHRHRNKNRDRNEYNPHRIPKPKAKHRDVRYHEHDQHGHSNSSFRGALYEDEDDHDLTGNIENHLAKLSQHIDRDAIEMQNTNSSLKRKRGRNGDRDRYSKQDRRRGHGHGHGHGHNKYTKRDRDRTRKYDKSGRDKQSYQHVNQSDDEEDSDIVSRSDVVQNQIIEEEDTEEDTESETGSESESEYEGDEEEDETGSEYDDDEETDSSEEESSDSGQGTITTYQGQKGVRSSKRDKLPLAPKHASPSLPGSKHEKSRSNRSNNRQTSSRKKSSRNRRYRNDV